MNGMTLIELVLVMLIIGVLAFAVIPKINDFFTVDLYAAIKLIASDIKFAQSQSIAQRQRYGLRFEAGLERYVVFHPVTGDTIIRHLEHVDLVSADFDGSQFFEFDSFGTPFRDSTTELASPGRIIVAVDGVVDTVTVFPLTGKVEF